jgi:lipoprotein signal peptidase
MAICIGAGLLILDMFLTRKENEQPKTKDA